MDSNKNDIQDQLKNCTQIIHHSENIQRNLQLAKIQNEHVNEQLKEIKSDLEDQYNLLNRKEFTIACVGNEKAGKSTLLNAWIGEEILPSKSKRCTATIVEVRHSKTDTKKYSIEYFTKQEFDYSVNKLKNNIAVKKQKKKQKTNNQVDQDLITEEEIAKIDNVYKNLVENYLGKEKEEKTFKEYDEQVKKYLEQAISEEVEDNHARAVKKVCIWIPSKELSDIVLVDVPGYDSALEYHRVQTEKIIDEVDALLIAKDIRRPNLNQTESKILKLSSKSNKYILN